MLFQHLYCIQNRLNTNQKTVYTANFSSFIQILIENLCMPGIALETKSSKMNKSTPGPQVADRLVLAN